MRIPAKVAFLVLLAAFAGCDDRPHGEQAAAPPPPPATKPWPTTQEFLAMPRKPTPLVFLPLTMSIPDGWKLDPPDGPTSLEGPAPSGNIEISIAILAPMKQSRVDLLVQGAHQEASLNPHLIVHDLPPINGLRAFEKFSCQEPSTEPSTAPSIDLSIAPSTSATPDAVQASAVKEATAADSVSAPAGGPAPGNSPMASTAPGVAEVQSMAVSNTETISWNVIMFVPYQDKFVPCSFDLIGLTATQLDQDEAFVRSMLDSAVQAKDMDPATF